MDNKKFIVAIFALTIVLIAGGVYFVSKTGNSAHVEANSETKAAVEKSTYNWGEIGLNDGNVEKTFEIKNEGDETLKLFDVTTSCMCTTAQLSLGESVSPLFGMHSKSDYVLEVPSGETAKLKVIFDPAFHGPSGVGPINRQVRVRTNDSFNSELNFMLTAMVRK